MSSSDTTPLLAGSRPGNGANLSSSVPQSSPAQYSTLGSSSYPSKSQPQQQPQRHWSEETEDIVGPDPNAYGNANASGPGYRRRGVGNGGNGRGPVVPGTSGPYYNGDNYPYSGPYNPSSSSSSPRFQSLPYSSDLDAQRFSGQERASGLSRICLGCCCFPCRKLWYTLQEKYTRTERVLMAATTLFFLLAVGFLVAYVRAKESLPASGKNGLCTSRECAITAADILRDMNPDTDPCQDFFAFTCGGFVNRVPIPDDKAQVGYFNLVKQQNQDVIRSILTPESTNVKMMGGKDDASKRNLVKLQSLFESCMDEKKISEVGVKPLYEMVQKMIKVFPSETSVLDKDVSDHDRMAYFDRLRELNEKATLAPKMAHRLQINQEQELVQHQEDLDPENTPASRVLSGEDGGLARNEDLSPIDTFVGKDMYMKREADAAPSLGPDPDMAMRENLALAISQLAWAGIATMVDFDVDADPKNPDVNVFRLGEDGLGLPSKEYYNEDKVVAVYQKAIEDMFATVMNKDNIPKSTFSKPLPWTEVAKNVVEFEKLLAAISSDPEDLENSELTYNPRTLRQITEAIPNIDWTVIMEKLLTKGVEYPDPIIVSSPDYLEKLNALLKDTPTVTLQNYFAWRMIQQLASSLGVEFRKPLQQLRAALQGVSADLVTPRWETCVDVVDTALGAMAGHYFIERSFQGDSKGMADDIITSLRTAFVKGLPKLPWLDQATLENATEKVDLLVQKIGYSIESPDVKSSDSLETFFKDLTIDKVDFFGNQIQARTWGFKRTLEQLGQPVDKARWLMSPQTVNAYYNPSANEIVFPAGILQQPFFRGSNPEYLNYGGIGVVAGHELTHAFDNEGRLYDAHGRLSDWWSNSTLEEFRGRSQCFVDQYGNFTVKDPQGRENHVNGKLTLGENLADNGGLKKAFEAWQARFREDPHGDRYKNHLLAGLEEYSREQLFYMAFGRVWCSQRRPASAIEGLRTDPHAPARWRVNGAVQNSAHFAEVFGCKPRSPMNPDSKCDLW